MRFLEVDESHLRIPLFFQPKVNDEACALLPRTELKGQCLNFKSIKETRLVLVFPFAIERVNWFMGIEGGLLSSR